MYKLLGFQGYLNVEELPRQVKIFERTVNLEIQEENLHDSVAVYGDSFLTDVFNNSIANNSSGCILLLCCNAVALFKYGNAAGNSAYFFFDSHCRNYRGITNRELGFSVLINFDSLFSKLRDMLKKHISFQVEFICHISKSNLSQLLSIQMGLQ